MSRFKHRPERDEQGLVAAVPGAAVREGEMTTIQVHGRKLILTRWEGRVYAIHSECPHAAADLSRGALHRWKITCPEHDYCFDIRNGRLLWPADEHYRLRMFEVWEEVENVMRLPLGRTALYRGVWIASRLNRLPFRSRPAGVGSFAGCSRSPSPHGSSTKV